jgi:calcineurin-like phosphoesterase family protein
MNLELEPGRKVWLTADSHAFHDNIVSYCRRPILTAAQSSSLDGGERRVPLSDAQRDAHLALLVSGVNGACGPDDVLVHLGDVALRGRVSEFRKRLAVKEIWVLPGNHDDRRELCRVFGRDRVLSARTTLSEGDKPVALLNHYPLGLWEGAKLLLHGHQHRKPADIWSRTPAGVRLDCGVDGHNFRPWAWEEIARLSGVFSAKSK